MKLVKLGTPIISIFFFLILHINTFAGEGMWLPQLLKSLNEGEMKDLGFKLTAEDIYSINKGSLKDAIVHFGGFCTSEIISDQGLLLTNHHCGYGQIQSHSSIENNLLENGFWAMNLSEELANPGLKAIFIKRIDEVSSQVLEGIDENLNGAERQSAIDKNITKLREQTQLGEYEDIQIKPFYKGNQYYMITTVSYPDVRLVGAPPSSIGKFGSDTDNWIWPRHTGDFALFRIYANADNEPAEYSEKNIPFTPAKHLEIAMDGVKEGDFTMVFGFPGRTNEYLPASAIDQLVHVLNPKKIEIRDEALKIIDAEMKANPEVKIKYASKFARIANYWKKWIGENQGLNFSDAIKLKKEFENEFLNEINKDVELKSKYGNVLSELNTLYSMHEEYALANALFFETFYRNIELGQVSYLMYNILKRSDGEQKDFVNYKERISDYLKDFHKNYEPDVDKKVFQRLMELYLKNAPGKAIPLSYSKLGEEELNNFADIIFKDSKFTDATAFSELMDIEDASKFREAVENDLAFQFFNPFIEKYFDEMNPQYESISKEIDDNMRNYMAAQMAAFPNKRFYPDANSTMRVTYGQVRSYSPKDAVEYKNRTYLHGVIEKYIPKDYEFDVPEKLIELYKNKNFGQYADDTGDVPVCFIGTNHTTGGNSGSPALDAYGRLVGLNFDRVWEGTMSDYHYDARICRNIMVDVRYILFIVDKFAGAGHLVEEMDLVYEN